MTQSMQTLRSSSRPRYETHNDGAQPRVPRIVEAHRSAHPRFRRVASNGDELLCQQTQSTMDPDDGCYRATFAQVDAAWQAELYRTHPERDPTKAPSTSAHTMSANRARYQTVMSPGMAEGSRIGRELPVEVGRLTCIAFWRSSHWG